QGNDSRKHHAIIRRLAPSAAIRALAAGCDRGGVVARNRSVDLEIRQSRTKTAAATAANDGATQLLDDGTEIPRRKTVSGAFQAGGRDKFRERLPRAAACFEPAIRLSLHP